jgi:hypothetical protein
MNSVRTLKVEDVDLVFQSKGAGSLAHILDSPFGGECAMLVFSTEFALEDAIGSHACSLDASTRVTNGIPLG